MDNEDSFDTELRKAFSDLAKKITAERGSILKAAEHLGKTRSSIEKMKMSGSGSVTTWARLIALHFGVGNDDLVRMIKNLGAPHSETDSKLDDLYSELKKFYTHQELAGWFKLMRDKGRIESDLGIRIKIESDQKDE